LGIAISDVDAHAGVTGVPPIPDPVAAVSDLRVTFRRNGRDVHALRGVSMSIAPGEILGLVGESGSGKSVLGFSVLGLLPAAACVEGTVRVAGSDMVRGGAKALRKVRALDLGAVFQDPMSSLNPTMRIGKQVAEATGNYAEALRLLTAVGIPEPKRRMRAYPHELSGGLRQRVMIAIAIAGDPELIIADEPTTALDVTIQAQILHLIQELQEQLGMAVILITHDLGVVAEIADRIEVMYGGRIVEEGTVDQIFYDPQHPYTWGLLGSIARPDRPRTRRLSQIKGQPPSLLAPPEGCHFRPRCPFEFDKCPQVPELTIRGGEAGHLDRCWLSAERKRSVRVVEGDQIGLGATA
jgi:peptide/nickel transport system ATP-binding protein